MPENNDDLLGKLLDDELDPKEGDDGTGNLPSNEDVKALKEQINALEKERHGLLQDVKSERRKRQDISGRLNQLTDTVNGIISTRQQQPAADPTAQPTKDVGGIPVEFNEDGDGIVKTDAIKELLTPYEQKIQELEDMLQRSSSATTAQREAENIKNSIIGEDERFIGASQKYNAARKWVVDQVTDFANTNNVGRMLTSGEALDYVFDKNLESEFKALYPNLRLEDIVTAEDSQRHFRNTLAHIADALTPTTPEDKMDERFQKVLRKPSGLGNQQNSKAGELTVSEKVGSLKAMDIMDLSDAQIDTLIKAMQTEEKQDGIRF